MLNINISTPSSILDQVRDKFKSRRLYLKLTQSALSKRSGVSLGSLKRFEATGLISFESLLKLALVLECLDDFQNIANFKQPLVNSIDEILNSNKQDINKRGSIR